MNKVIKRVLAAVMSVALLTTTATATPTQTFAETASQTATTQIGLNQDNYYTLDYSGKACKDTFEENYVYQFTLDKTSVVDINSTVNAFTQNFVGDAYVRISNTTTFGASAICSAFADGSTSKKILVLEAGTYYLQVKIVKDGYAYDGNSYVTNPTLNIRVNTTDASRTDGWNGNSYATAIPTTSGEVSNGTISTDITAQYFKIVVNATSNVSIDIASVGGQLIGTDAHLSCKLTDDMGKDYGHVGAFDYINDSSCNITVSNLAKGTYYLVVSHYSSSDNGSRFALVNVKPTIETVKLEKLKAPKLTSYKKGSKKITGTAVAGSTVTVQIKNTVKKVKVSSKGKFTIKLSKKLKKGQKIKVKAKKTGYTSSKTVTYKVK